MNDHELRAEYESCLERDRAHRAEVRALQTALADAEAELRHRCPCRWESIDGDVLLRHECDGHKQTRLARNAALDRERELRAQVATLEDGKAAFFQYTYTPEREASKARITELEELVEELKGIRADLERQMRNAAKLHAEREHPIVDEDLAGICVVCGEPMPPGEEMFKFHGYSGPCPEKR